MKEFYKTQKVTYNLMSFTGFKALIIFSLLAEGPKSFDDVINYIGNHQYLHEKISTDTVRVYINSLKRIGCEIKRTKGDDNISRYMITSHPFELKLSDEQIKSIIKVYKTLVKNMDVKDLLYMNNLFEKIGLYIKNQEFTETLKNLSLLKDIDKNILEELINCCEKKLQIVIEYNSPNSGIKDIELICDKVDINNNKIYLCGYGFEYNEYGTFLLHRIRKVREIKLNKTIPQNLEEIKVIYELETYNQPIQLKDNETVLNKSDTKYKIQITGTNMFFIKQHLLELGPACKVIEPESVKQDLISTLKDMKAGYYCD